MPAPSLSEITSIQGDASIGAGANGLNLGEAKFDASLPYLQAASAAAAEADKQTLAQYNANLSSQLARANSMDFSKVAPQDFKDLTQSYAGLLKNIADNYDVIRNPQKNLEKWGEIQQSEAQINANLARSKDSKTIYDESQKFLDMHPIWNTDVNQKKLQDFLNLPVDQRQPFQFEQPFNADIARLASTALAGATVKVSDAEIVPGGKYIKTTEGTVFDKDKYEQILRSSLNGTDEFSRANREGYQQLLDKLPPQEKAKYADVDDFVIKNAAAFQGVNTTTSTKLDENKIYMQEQRDTFEASEGDKNRAMEQQRINLEKQARDQAQKAGTMDKQAAGELKNQLMTSLFSTGQAPTSILQDIYGDNTEVEVKSYTMADDTSVPPDEKTGLYEQKKVGEVTAKKPLLVVIGSELDPKTGQVIIHRRNSQTGKQVAGLRITAAQANSDLNNIAGKTNAALISQASRQYLKGKIGTEEFDLNKIKAKNLFGFGDNATGNPAKPQVQTSPKVTDSPYKNSKFTMSGKPVSNDVLLRAYTNDQIKEFIAKGLLKQAN